MSRGPSPPSTGRLPGAEKNSTMDEHNGTTPEQSVTERQMSRLVVPAPAGYDSSGRIDVLHEPDLHVL